MHVLLLGGTGGVGRLALSRLLEQGHSVIALVRSTTDLPVHQRLEIVQTTVLECDDPWLADCLGKVDAVVSCLGHRPTFSGLYGHPRRLVHDSLNRVLQALAAQPRHLVKVILLGSSGCPNSLQKEQLSIPDRLVLTLVRHLVPPHADNEQAARLLANQRRHNTNLEWVVVRPDSLTNAESMAPYDTVASPTRSPIFNPGQSSRHNVAHFMEALLSDASLWARWRHQMPVLYNTSRA